MFYLLLFYFSRFWLGAMGFAIFESLGLQLREELVWVWGRSFESRRCSKPSPVNLHLSPTPLPSMPLNRCQQVSLHRRCRATANVVGKPPLSLSPSLHLSIYLYDCAFVRLDRRNLTGWVFLINACLDIWSCFDFLDSSVNANCWFHA